MSDSGIIERIGFVKEQIDILEGFRPSFNTGPIPLNTSREDGKSAASAELQGNAADSVGPQNMTATIEVTNVDQDGKPTSDQQPVVTVIEVKNNEDKVIQTKGGALAQKGGNKLTKEDATKIANALSEKDLTASIDLKTKVDDLVGKLNAYENDTELPDIFKAADEVKTEAEKAEGNGEVANPTNDPANPTNDPNRNGKDDAEGGGKRRSRRRRRHSSKKKKKKKSRRRKGSRRK